MASIQESEHGESAEPVPPSKGRGDNVAPNLAAVRWWWRQPCGGRDLLKLGLPLIVSTTSYTLLHFCDRLFLAWHSTDEMGAVMVGGSITWSAICLPFGLAAYATTFVAQYVGAGQHHRIGAIIWASLRVGLYSAPLFLVLGIFAPQLFQAFGHEPRLQNLEALYVQILAFGSPAAILAAGLSALFIGQGRTRVVMVIDVITATTNILLDYLAIFGHAGFPRAGLMGAAWATVAAMWLKFLLYVYVTWKDPDRHRYCLREGRRVTWGTQMSLLRFGFPNGLQFLQEASSFTLFQLFIGQLGILATTATTIAISVNIVAFVPILGIGMAVSTMVGQQIGRGDPELAERATWTGLAIAIAYSSLFVVTYLVLPHYFLQIYQLSGPDAEKLIQISTVLLRFVAAYCVFDAVQMVFVSAIKGAGDTLYAMQASMLLMIGLFAAGLWGVGFWPSLEGQLYWWWSVLTLWLWSMATAFYLRFASGKWKTMSVISTEAGSAG